MPQVLGLWLFFGLIGLAIGMRKGLSLPLAFVAGCLLGPLSLLMVFVSSDKRKCPSCDEWVSKKASKCPRCQEPLPLWPMAVAKSRDGG